MQPIPVATVVGMVADQITEEKIIAAFPDLEQADIHEALRYAADAVRRARIAFSYSVRFLVDNALSPIVAVRPHALLGYRPPAPEVFVPALSACPAALRRPAPPATLALPPALS